MTDFEAMDIMAGKNMGIKMSGAVLGFNSTKKKSTVTIEIDYDTAQMLASEIVENERKHYIVLYIINKEQFDQIKNENP